jgi:ferredoxin
MLVPTRNGGRMKVSIDRERCEGHGRCYSVCPELFEPDEVGQGRPIGAGEVPKALARGARLAEANCPEHAVIVEGD